MKHRKHNDRSYKNIDKFWYPGEQGDGISELLPFEGLTAGESKFVWHYTSDEGCIGRAVPSARRAGFQDTKTARALLRKQRLRDVIDTRLQEVMVSAPMILSKMMELLDTSYEDFIDIDENGDYTYNLKKAEETGALHKIRELTLDRNGKPSVKLHDPTKVLELFAKYYGFFTNDTTGNLTLEIKLPEEMKEKLKDTNTNV